MTNHWIDIKNANAILIMGSNAAEHHPISFKWVLKARDAGAKVMHVDPKFSRTSARSDMHVPLRSGTDIPFLAGMVRYILEKDKFNKEYVTEYTNAAFIVGEGYDFKNGLFSGYDPASRKYDQKKWAFELDENSVPKRDRALQHPRSVFQLMKQHYSRYTLEKVSAITGVSRENLLKVYEIYAATGARDKAGTIMYAVGWTQHTVGVQISRLSTIVQLLLGISAWQAGASTPCAESPTSRVPRIIASSGTACLATCPCPEPIGRRCRTISKPTRPRPATPRAPIGGATGRSTWSACSRVGWARPQRVTTATVTTSCPSRGAWRGCRGSSSGRTGCTRGKSRADSCRPQPGPEHA